MAFKMNGSPAKMGTIQGTAGHSSALKMKAEADASALKKINEDGSVTIPALDKSKKTKHGTKTYKSAYDEMKTEVPKRGKTDKYGNTYNSQKDFEKAADDWWASEAGQKKASAKGSKFAHRVIKKAEPTKTEKVVAKGEVKKTKIATKSAKKTAEVTENVDKKTAKIARKTAKKEHGKGSTEHLKAKQTHLKAKESDRQGEKGGKKQSIFRRLSSKINKKRQAKNQAKIDAKKAE